MSMSLVWAQQKASVRSGVHDGYVRFVFDFDAAPKYEVVQDEQGNLNISFDEARNITMSDSNYSGIEYVTNLNSQSSADTTNVDISLLASPRYRAFSIGNRVIVDIYQPSEQALKTALDNRPQQQAVEATTNQQIEENSSEQARIPNEPNEPQIQEDAEVANDTPAALTVNQVEDIPDDPTEQTQSTEEVEVAQAPNITERDEPIIRPEREKSSGPEAKDSDRISARDLVVDMSDPEALKALRKRLGVKDSSEEQEYSDDPFDRVENEKADQTEGSTKAQDQQIQMPKNTALESERPEVRSHIITMTLTETVGVSAFLRADWLWIVLDRQNVEIPPKIQGPEADRFPAFIRQEIEGGVAFRLQIPEEMNLRYYAEGGGLLWRIILSEESPKFKSTLLKRFYNSKDFVRGAEILWPFKSYREILEVPDPTVGDVLNVITVADAEDFSGSSYHFVDLNVLQSIVGAAIQVKNEDVDITPVATGVKVVADGGLAISRRKDVARRILREEVRDEDFEALAQEQEQKEIIRVFDFERWRLGGIQALDENQRLVLASIAAKDKTGQVQDLLTLAKINIANDRGQEAIGFMVLAAETLPEIKNSLEFRALLGVAYALAGKHRQAFRHLFYEELDPYTEIDYWRAYNLAWLEDWDQAGEVLPYDFSVMLEYPGVLLEKIGIKSAEIALRNGYITEAETVLASLTRNSDGVAPSTDAAITYLKGVAHNLSGEYNRAEELWEPLSRSKDDFFRARAGLALVLQGLQTEQMNPAEAVEYLEGLRFAWRGDELEASISFVLGQQYVEKDLYIRGFTLLREAASLRPDTDISRDITEYMLKAYRDIILYEEDLSPIDAAALYEEFRELVPVGEGAHEVIAKLAERMVDADLLQRAAVLLENQVQFRLEGLLKARTSERLATIYLLDDKPSRAYNILLEVRENYQTLYKDPADREKNVLRANLLIARSLSQQDQPEEALELLDGLGTASIVSRLRADIAWQAGLWGEASDAIQNLIIDANIDENAAMTESQAELVLNRAVALNLAGDRVGVASMRTKYSKSIEPTQKARLFEVVTRPRQTSIIADQQTISSLVAEVDLFKEFLNSYGKGFAGGIE